MTGGATGALARPAHATAEKPGEDARRSTGDLL